MTDQATETEFAAGSDKDGDAVPGSKNLPKAGRKVIAGVENDITIPFFSNVLEPQDEVVIKRGKGKGLALYDEIERDTHAGPVLQKRKSVLVAREWEVTPGGEDQRDLDAAEFVETQLGKLPFDRICEDLLDATLKGFAVSEIVWWRDGKHIVPRWIISHDQRRWKFDKDWKLRLLTRENMIDGDVMMDRKFIVHRRGVKGNNPYGVGLGQRLFWPTLFKREGVAFWLTFLDKFALPTVHGKVPFGLGDAEEQKLIAALAGAAKNASILTPMGVEVDLLEAARSGSVSYEAWCQYWDNQISIAVLGETLTTDVQKNGSLAAGEVHAAMLEMLIDADADLLSSTLKDTLIRWLVEYNFPGAALPSIKRVRETNLQAEAETEEKQASAAAEREKTIRQVVASAANIEDDDAARDYIAEFVPGELDAEMLDILVANRMSFSAAPEADPADPLKKKDLTPANDPSSTAGFADAADDPDLDIQEVLTGHLDALGVAWDADRLSRISAVLDSAENLEDASVRLLREAATWNISDYAGALELALTASAYAGRDAVVNEIAEAPSFAEADVFSQPFQEQIDFFRQKSPRPTRRWTDILRGDHDRAFMIAGAKDLDMLRDFQEAILNALEQGRTLDDFRKDFDRIVGKYGWSYKGERGWRSRVIFETNVRTSYMAGRLKQMRDPDVIKMRPFWQYRHGQTRKPKVPRRSHLAWNGLVLPHDDPFWDTHFPPNGWRCSCGVRTLSRADLTRLGKTGPDESPPQRVRTIYDPRRGGMVDVPEGLGFGFEYAPGDLWERGLVPSHVERLASTAAIAGDTAKPIADLIAGAPRMKAKTLKSGEAAEFYVDAFLKGFGAKRGQAVLFEDKAGSVIPISDELFREANGELKVMKRGREVHAAQIAEAIRDPDEIWMGVARVRIPDDHGGGTEVVVDRKYIRVDPKTGLLAIFELVKGRWTAKTAFRPKRGNSTSTDVNQIDRRRNGVLIYERKK